MTRAAKFLFGGLIVATFLAFFVAQRAKNMPSVIQSVRFHSAFSPAPGKEARRSLQVIKFRLKRTTDVTVEIVDEDDQMAIKTLARDLPVQKYRQVRLTWDGSTDSGGSVAKGGRIAADGRYRLKILLPAEGRSIVYYRSFALDTTPPKPKVLRVGPRPSTSKGPLIVSAQDTGTINAALQLGGWDAKARVLRITPNGPALVKNLKITGATSAATGPNTPKTPATKSASTSWDGRDAAGKKVVPGNYVIQACVLDLAQNRGCGPSLGQGKKLAAPESNGRYRGKGGITVRGVAVQPSLVPRSGGKPLTFFVDSRGLPYNWTLKRLEATGVRTVSSGKVTGDGDNPPKVALRVASSSSKPAAYTMTVKAGEHSAEVPAVQTGVGKHRVLVVLPALTWVGRNTVDDNGDGLPNTLNQGPYSRASSTRVFDALPRGFGNEIEPVMRWLAKNKKRFDLTTDLALSQRAGAAEAQLEGHRGVLLVGQQRWTTTKLASELRKFAQAGGKVAVLDPESLHRTVKLSAGGKLNSPTLSKSSAFSAADVFDMSSEGAEPIAGSIQTERDKIGLFEGTDGKFDGYRNAWPLSSESSALMSNAIDAKGRSIIGALPFGKGLVIRFGLPKASRRVGTDPDTASLMESTWQQLSR